MTIFIKAELKSNQMINIEKYRVATNIYNIILYQN